MSVPKFIEGISPLRVVYVALVICYGSSLLANNAENWWVSALLPIWMILIVSLAFLPVFLEELFSKKDQTK